MGSSAMVVWHELGAFWLVVIQTPGGFNQVQWAIPVLDKVVGMDSSLVMGGTMY
jgi:hypothetical protein